MSYKQTERVVSGNLLRVVAICENFIIKNVSRDGFNGQGE